MIDCRHYLFDFVPSHRRILVNCFSVLCSVVFLTILTEPAHAGREAFCADQYSFEEQTTLEWAALGGDPHAQFALAQCALPKNARSLTDAQRDYAVKWVTLAACDAEGAPHLTDRDRMLRGLREKGDISFRRFGGMEGDEKLSRQARRVRDYREIKVAELLARYERLGGMINETERAKGRDLLSDDLARIGPLGLSRLSSLAMCPFFNNAAPFAAGVYAATADAWSDHPYSAVYRERSGPADYDAELKNRMEGLSSAQRETAIVEKARLLKTDPERLAILEEKAALGRLQDLGFLNAVPSPGPSRTDLHSNAANRSEARSHRGGADASIDAEDNEAFATGSSLTLAVQYALEAMGLMSFNKGPDNDYGPATIAAAGLAQERYGREATRWLTATEARQIVCDAATDKGDPISYYHLAVMFSRGVGYPRDLVRARYAISRAETALDAKLLHLDELPDWKQRSYPAFAQQISDARALIASAWTTAPARHKDAWRGGLSDENLCR